MKKSLMNYGKRSEKVAENITNYDKEDYFAYLDLLRENGETNMYGAGVYLQKEFGISKHEARAVLGEWIDNYDDPHYPAEEE
jgi:hypothetical protein